jgi:hypothetical protein
MENPMLQPAASSAEDIFAPDAVANAPAMAHVNPKGHIRTAGEKKFDRVTYNWLGYVANALLSVVAVAWVERTHGGQKMMDNFRGWAERNVKFVNPETAKMLATKTFFLAGGFAVMLPMKWLEDKKLEMVKKYDRQIYGDAVDTDPSIRQSHQDIENAPKQNWKSIIGSRILALVPFYAGYWLLWDKKSPLAKATNESLFVDRPIVAASRGIGKFFAKLTKNGEAEKTLSELNQTHLGEMLTPVEAGKIATKPDPLHSTVPYYFISEAITSAMVAWGVYVLSRVLAPILGTKKQQAAPAAVEVKTEVPAIKSAPVVAPKEVGHEKMHDAHHPHTAADVKEQPEEKTSEKKHELAESKPETKVHADTLQHHHTHHAEAAHAHGAH